MDVENVEYEDALHENDVSDWGDLVQAFSTIQNHFSEPLKSADKLSSPPLPNLNELTWSRTYRALRAHKDIQARLLQEMQNVEATISFLQMSCNKLALRRGLRLLPNEILAMIFELGYTSDLEGNRFAIALSHVNRRFRHISLQMPRLWSTITNYQGVSELEEFLIRSKNTGISVRLLENLAEPNFHAVSLNPIVLRHSQQWIEFEYAINRNIATGSALSNCVLHLPNLRKLTDCHGYLGETFLKWSMPCLVNYKGELNPVLSSTTLVSCTLDLWEGEDNDRLNRLLSLLSSNPTLRSLALNFHEYIPYMDRDQADPTVTLSSLETFSVHFSGGCYISHDVGRFMENLVLPHITQLSLHVLSDPVHGHQDFSDTSGIFRMLFRGLNPYPTLDKLVLIMDSFYSVPSRALEDLLDKLPSLRRLYVEAPRFSPPFYPWTGMSLPPLHFVELSRCDQISRGFVESFLDILLQNDHSAEHRIQTFTVANCRGLSRSSFRNLEAKLGDRFVFLP